MDLRENVFVCELFNKILEAHKGKVLYLDFWSVSCPHCLKQFPYAKTLHETLKAENIEFINLCNKTDSLKWNKMIEKYDIKGENYMLTNDEKTCLENIFQFGGNPRYMIVDKLGIFVDTDAKRPSREEIKEQLMMYANK